jgi:integrase/recombinase XerC
MSAGISARSLSRKISALKSFWRFLLKNNRTNQNPVKNIVLPKTKKALPAFFKQSEMDDVLDDTFLPEEFERVRDHLIIKLFYATGIRLSELINIEDKDIDAHKKSLRVIGKRNKERIIPISEELLENLQNYISLREREISKEDANLFLRKNGKKMYPMLVYNIVHNSMAEVSAIHKKSPHVLRHTFATAMLNEGADINAVKELLGHSSLAATQVYTHVSFDELYNIYKRAHPRANKQGGNYENKDSSY